jgi:UDP-N-acetylglucosamine enolpyruvyl transferase
MDEEVNVRLLPPSPPRAVVSTAILSASPVSTLKEASMYTEREDRSRISIVGSYALIGRCPSITLVPTAWIGCNINKRGFEQYKENWKTLRGRYTEETGSKPVHGE